MRTCRVEASHASDCALDPDFLVKQTSGLSALADFTTHANKARRTRTSPRWTFLR